MADDPTATAALQDWPCTDPAHLGLCSDGHVHAAHIPYEGTDCTAEEAVEAVEAVRATAAPRSACGNGSMDDDEHALICVACNIARHNDQRRDQRLRRTPKPLRRRVLNKLMRMAVLGDPTFLPTDDGGTRYGRVQ